MVCSHCGEDKKIAARGLCTACYSRLKKTGSPNRTKHSNIGKTCSVDGCGQPARTKGMCMLHYQRSFHPARMTWKLLRHRLPGQYPPSWESFAAFLADVGEKPSPLHQLRRIDSALPYSKENARWLAPVNPEKPKGWSTEKRTSYMREWNFRRFYGITAETYDRMLADQSGLCAICRQGETQIAKKSGQPRALHVDHDHKTEAVRGLTCSACNNGLGHFKDSPTLLRAAAAYLEAHAEPKAGDITTSDTLTETIRVIENSDAIAAYYGSHGT